MACRINPINGFFKLSAVQHAQAGLENANHRLVKICRIIPVFAFTAGQGLLLGQPLGKRQLKVLVTFKSNLTAEAHDRGFSGAGKIRKLRYRKVD
ncbi:hypothetical protein D3C81_1728800 [compost metagenome]